MAFRNYRQFSYDKAEIIAETFFRPEATSTEALIREMSRVWFGETRLSVIGIMLIEKREEGYAIVSPTASDTSPFLEASDFRSVRMLHPFKEVRTMTEFTVQKVNQIMKAHIPRDYLSTFDEEQRILMGRVVRGVARFASAHKEEIEPFVLLVRAAIDYGRHRWHRSGSIGDHL